MRKVPYASGSFDVVLSLFTSFGYFEDPDDDRRVLDNVALCLRQPGTFLLQMMGKETGYGSKVS